MAMSPEQEHALLRAVQDGVPFASRPFAELGQAIGESEQDVLAVLRAMNEAGTLREISAVVEGAAVGYESALVAAQVPAERLEQVVQVINAHPTVTHNYERDHDYNLWFTLAVPAWMGLERTARLLAQEAGVSVMHLARRRGTYKIGVNIDLATRQNNTKAAPNSGQVEAPEPVTLREAEQAVVRALQQPLPLEARPFEALAEAHGTDSELLTAFGRRHLGGLIRRYAGVLRHRKLGVRSNGMVAWNVPEASLDAVGAILAQVPEVSHCYARDPFPGFPYDLYTMVHAPDTDVLDAVTARMAEAAGVRDFRVLVSTREFKKTRLRYFLHELEAWWRARQGEEAVA